VPEVGVKEENHVWSRNTGIDRDLRDRSRGLRSKKLPDLAEPWQGYAEFKRATEEVKETIETEVRAAESKIDIEKLKSDVEGKEAEPKVAEAGKGDAGVPRRMTERGEKGRW